MKLVLPTLLFASFSCATAPLNGSFGLTTQNVSSFNEELVEITRTGPKPKSDVFDVLQQPQFVQRSGNWTELQCGPHWASIDGGRERWESANAKDALNDVVKAWRQESLRDYYGDISFVDFVFTAFQQKDSKTPCEQLHSVDCTIPVCGGLNDISPAGTAITNSIAAFNRLISQRQRALKSAEEILNNQVLGLVQTFMPIESQSEIEKAKMALGIVEMVFSLVSAGTVSSVFNGVKALQQVAETAGKVKDFVEKTARVSKTVLENMDNLREPETEEQASANLEKILEVFGEKLKTQNEEFLSYSLDGGESLDSLQDLLNTGVLLDVIDSSSDFEEFTVNNASALLHGAMIQNAWKMSKDIRPFILRIPAGEQNCNEELTHEDLRDRMSPEAQEKSRWCDPSGNSWYLLHWNRVFGGFKASRYMFEPVMGANGDILNGEDFGGIKYGDIFLSAFSGFQRNDNQNGYSIYQDSGQKAQQDFGVEELGLPMSGGHLTPGFFTFDICLNWKEPIETHKDDKSKVVEQPCGLKPKLSESDDQQLKAKGHAPGTCKVEVEQWARGGDNRLNEFLTAIKVFDASGDEVGNAAKDAGEDPRVVVNSLLPYNLIVDTHGDASVGDHLVEFWYSDQWWLSIDQEHRCNFRPWDGSYRWGDCFFECPRPVVGEEPPKSAINDRRPAEAPETAIAASKTFSNPWITAAPPPPSAILAYIA